MPDILEQVRPVDLQPAALPLEKLRHMLVRVEGAVQECWGFAVGLDSAGINTVGRLEFCAEA